MRKNTTGPQGRPSRASVRLDVAAPLVTRESQVPGHGVPHGDKLRKAGAVDVRGNAVVERTGGGFLRIQPKDVSKRHG
jgi:hypothetical protein